MGGVWAVLLFPSPYHGVLAVKGGARLCALASWRPSATPDCLRCAVLATVPGNSARATGARSCRNLRKAPAALCPMGQVQSSEHSGEPCPNGPETHGYPPKIGKVAISLKVTNTMSARTSARPVRTAHS